MTDIEFRVEVVDRLARIETKLDAMGTHEARLQTLENGRSRWGGIVATASVVLSTALTLILRHFGK